MSFYAFQIITTQSSDQCTKINKASIASSTYSQVDFYLFLDCLDTSSTPFLLVFKLESVHRSLLSRDLVNCADVCPLLDSCFVQ